MLDRYLDRLTQRDLDILAVTVGGGADADGLRIDLARRPHRLSDLLSEPELVDHLFDPRHGIDKAPSALLVFGVLVHRVASDLFGANFVSDWVGPRCRLPVFDVEPLQEFLEAPGRCWYLIDLLDSFVTSAGPTGPSPAALASQIETAHPAVRGQILRKLGDFALFMTGIFPDHTGATPVTPVDAERLGRTAGMTEVEILTLSTGRLPSTAALEWMEALGERWYRLAIDQGRQASHPVPPVVGDVALRFTAGRRVLNLLADRYLNRSQPDWFPGAA